MPRTARDEFDEGDDVDRDDDEPTLSERDDPDESDIDDDEGDEYAEAIPCPYCRKPVYEGAEICPNCNSFISFEDTPTRYRGWLWAGVVLCLLVVLFWALSSPRP